MTSFAFIIERIATVPCQFTMSEETIKEKQMKVIDILNARDSLVKLIKVRFIDFKTTIAVYRLTKKVDEVIDMAQKEQDKIIDIYVAKGPDSKPIIENGNFKFESAENRDKFLVDVNNLRNEDISDIEKLTIKLDSIQIATDISPEDILKMELVINWV